MSRRADAGVVAQPLLTGHFRVFISTFCNLAVWCLALRTGCRIAVSIRTSHRPSDAEHRVGSLPQRSWRPPIPSFVCQGHASNMAHCVASRIRATENTSSRLTLPYKRCLFFPEPVLRTPLGQRQLRHGETGSQKFPCPTQHFRYVLHTDVKSCNHGRIADPIGGFQPGWHGTRVVLRM